MKAGKRRSSAGSIWVVAGIAALAVGGLIAASVWSSTAREQAAALDEAKKNVVVPAAKPDAELGLSRFTMGKPEAKAELVEYGDFL